MCLLVMPCSSSKNSNKVPSFSVASSDKLKSETETENKREEKAKSKETHIRATRKQCDTGGTVTTSHGSKPQRTKAIE